jgi:autonomous glycyl radical cofactor GrcA
MPNYRCSWLKEFRGNNMLLNIGSYKATNDKVNINLDLYNVGTVPDAFVIRLHETSGSIIFEQKLETIEPGKKNEVKINVKPTLKTNGGRYMTVESLIYESNVKKTPLE